MKSEGGRCRYTRATQGTLMIMKVFHISALLISCDNTALWFCKCYHRWKLDKRHMGSILSLKLHVNLQLSQNNVQLKKCPHPYQDFNIYVNFPILAHMMKSYKLFFSISKVSTLGFCDIHFLLMTVNTLFLHYL